MFIPSGFETGKPMTMAEHRFTTLIVALLGALVAWSEYPTDGWWVGILFLPLAVAYYVVLLPTIYRQSTLEDTTS